MDALESVRKKGLRFGTYDFSNSGYVLIFQSFLFPLLIVNSTLSGPWRPETLWAAAVAGSSIIAILASPFVGMFADRRTRSRVFASLVLLAGIAAAVSPPLFGSKPLVLLLLFLIFNAIFEISQTLYDSFLKDLSSSPSDTVSISSIGWAVGYGGGVLFAVLYFVFDKKQIPLPWMLSIFGLLYLILSVPAIINFQRVNRDLSQPVQEMTARKWPRPPLPWRDLAIYWVIADCVTAVVYFAPLYAQREIGLSTTLVGALMLGTQVLAIFFTIIMGRVANKYGQVPTIQTCLVVWAIALLALFFARTTTHMGFVLLAVSIVIGSTQAILRAHFASRVGRDRAGESFGFYAIAQKSASVFAPALVGLTVMLTGAMRSAFLVLFIGIIIAYVLAGRLSSNPERAIVPDC